MVRPVTQRYSIHFGKGRSWVPIPDAIPRALKMVPMSTLLGAQHDNASTGFSSHN